jgi:hypothetical protein
MSKLETFYPLVSALVQAETILGKDRIWHAINEQQQHFITEIFKACRQEKVSEVETMVSWNAEDINKFLRNHRYDIRLNPFERDTFGIATILNLIVEWLEAGKITTVEDHLYRHYPAICLSQGLRFYRSSFHRYPIVVITTKSGDHVSMTRYDENPKNLEETVRKLVKYAKSVYDFEKVIFPMVDLNKQIDVSWLLNMSTMSNDVRPAYVSQAVQQTIFKMNETGAQAQSAFAGAITKRGGSSSEENMVINEPFLCWITRRDFKMPLFAGYITQQDWKNPGAF